MVIVMGVIFHELNAGLQFASYFHDNYLLQLV